MDVETETTITGVAVSLMRLIVKSFNELFNNIV